MADTEPASELFDALIFRFFGRLIARQFVVFGGVPAALARGQALIRTGIVPTYNRIDEHVRSTKQIEDIIASYVALVCGRGATDRGPLAIKASALGMELGPFAFARYLRRLINGVAGETLEIEVDAEKRETLCDVQQVLNVLKPKLPEGITFRPAFQMHLPAALRDVLVTEHQILDMPVRIVKGSGLYDIGAPELSESDVLARYYETFMDQIKNGKYPKVATVRDAQLLEMLTDRAMGENISPTRFTLQFLDGPFGRSLARKYTALGYRIGCYVTFVDPSAPDEWKGYVQRRIAFGRKLIFG